jgi:hypothetical protein
MGLPSQPVTLKSEQVEELNKKLSSMRHDINNHLSLMMAAVEMVKYKPDMLGRMMDNLIQQPPKITAVMAKFSDEFEKTLGITRS